jgi:AMIN domain
MLRVTKLRLLCSGALVASSAIVWSPLFAQTSGRISVMATTTSQRGTPKAVSTNPHAVNKAPSAVPNARIEHMVVRGTPEAMEIEIQVSGGAVAPDTQAITGPDRIIVDFPGALPAAELRALHVNRGALKGIRAGLFFDNPPITRIVLDLAEPQSYQISTVRNSVVVKLGRPQANSNEINSVSLNSGTISAVKLGQPKQVSDGFAAGGPAREPVAKLQNALLGASTPVASASSRAQHIAATVTATRMPSPNDEMAAAPAFVPNEVPIPKPSVVVTYVNGLLQIHADKATMAQVLFEVHRQTQAEIAIPSGAEQEQVAADIGPAPSRDVLAALLNGSSYNFIFVGTEEKLERVILTRRDAF